STSGRAMLHKQNSNTPRTMPDISPNSQFGRRWRRPTKRRDKVIAGFPKHQVLRRVPSWLATAFVAWILAIALASDSFAQPSATSVCDLPGQRADIYEKYCGSGPSAQTGGGVTPQQQILLNGAS